MASRLLRIVFKGMFGLFIFCVVFLAYGNFPNRWYHILYVNSGSMSPTIRPGDLIIITPPPSVLKPGMILTLSVNTSLVTHRLVGFGEYGELITRGDANSVVDAWDSSSLTVAGIYRARIPYLGYLAGLQGRLFKAVFSGAWFAESESISGELSTTTGWITPASPANPINLRGSLTVSPFYEDGHHGVDLRLCLINDGSPRIDGLHILNLIQFNRGSEDFSDVLSQFLDVSAHPSLYLGEEHCYEAHIGIDPGERGRYRDLVKVILTQQQADEQIIQALSPDTPVEFALELTADFSLLDPPAPSAPPTLTDLPATTAPTATITHTPAVDNTKIPTSTPLLPSSRPGASEDLRSTPTPAPTEMPTSTPVRVLPTETPDPSQLPTPGGNCIYPSGYWLEYPEAWPVDQFTLGDQMVDQRAALDLLSKNPREDASLKLAQALIVAKLNAWNRADWEEVAEEIAAADDWFTGHPAGSMPGGAEAEQAESLAVRLDEFNQGLAGAQACPDWAPTPVPTQSATPTAPEPSPSPGGTAIPTATEPEPPTPEPTLETPTEAPPPTAPVEEAPPATLESTPPAADPIDTLPPSEEAPPAETALP